MGQPPENMAHSSERPLTPPTTPDRPGGNKITTATPVSATEEQRKGWQVSDVGLITPQSMPRQTERSDQQTPHQLNQDPEQQQHDLIPQPVFSSIPADIQARRTERRKSMELSPTYMADMERRRVSRERQLKAQRERIDRMTCGTPDNHDVMYSSKEERLKEMGGMTFEETFAAPGQGQRVVKKIPVKARVPLRARAPSATAAAYVPPPNFGHRPGEAWQARREWDMFLRRREEVWGDPEVCNDEEGLGAEVEAQKQREAT